jgi:hypothetical protein
MSASLRGAYSRRTQELLRHHYAKKALVDMLSALGRTDEAQERLEQLATIEEIIH